MLTSSQALAPLCPCTSLPALHFSVLDTDGKIIVKIKSLTHERNIWWTGAVSAPQLQDPLNLLIVLAVQTVIS